MDGLIDIGIGYQVESAPGTDEPAAAAKPRP
jgi:hypothetical protein